MIAVSNPTIGAQQTPLFNFGPARLNSHLNGRTWSLLRSLRTNCTVDLSCMWIWSCKRRSLGERRKSQDELVFDCVFFGVFFCRPFHSWLLGPLPQAWGTMMRAAKRKSEREALHSLTEVCKRLVDVWNEWLERGLQLPRISLGVEFPFECYLHSWSFALWSLAHGEVIWSGCTLRSTKLILGLVFSHQRDSWVPAMQCVFFLSGCCMAQRRWLSGRSPFCQRKLSEESQIQWKYVSLKATKLTKTKPQKKHQPRCSLPESAGTGRCSLFLGRLDQGLSGNAESTHVNHPKGKPMLFSWVGRCCKFLKSNKLEFAYLRRICSAGWTWWKVALNICYCELNGFAWKSMKVKQWS